MLMWDTFSVRVRLVNFVLLKLHGYFCSKAACSNKHNQMVSPIHVNNPTVTR